MKKTAIIFIFLASIFACSQKTKNSQSSQKEVPPSPPFREAEAIISNTLTKGCSLSYKIGYLISCKEKKDDYEIVIQDKKGVRKTYFLKPSRASNADRSWLPVILIPGNKLKIAVESCKDTGECNEIKNLKNLKRKENTKDYLYGIPPNPPFRKINVTACTNITDGCSLSDKKWIGYIISYRKNRYGSGYEIIIQDKNGARETHFLETDEMPNADKIKLPHVLIPGNKLEMKVQFCGSGGFIYIMSLKTIKREK